MDGQGGLGDEALNQFVVRDKVKRLSIDDREHAKQLSLEENRDPQAAGEVMRPEPLGGLNAVVREHVGHQEGSPVAGHPPDAALPERERAQTLVHHESRLRRNAKR